MICVKTWILGRTHCNGAVGLPDVSDPYVCMADALGPPKSSKFCGGL
jgi:hypothetical protein